MSTVSKADLPPQSLLHGYMQPDDFVDCYSCATTQDIDEVASLAMDFPAWVDGVRAFGATWVHWGNWMGRADLATIMPFHVAIMRHAMGRVAQ